MSLNGDCGKSGQIKLVLCMMLPVVEVLCMPDQYQVLMPASRAFVGDFYPFIQQGLAELTKSL